MVLEFPDVEPWMIVGACGLAALGIALLWGVCRWIGWQWTALEVGKLGVRLAWHTRIPKQNESPKAPAQEEAHMHTDRHRTMRPGCNRSLLAQRRPVITKVSSNATNHPGRNKFFVAKWQLAIV